MNKLIFSEQFSLYGHEKISGLKVSVHVTYEVRLLKVFIILLILEKNACLDLDSNPGPQLYGLVCATQTNH